MIENGQIPEALNIMHCNHFVEVGAIRTIVHIFQRYGVLGYHHLVFPESNPGLGNMNGARSITNNFVECHSEHDTHPSSRLTRASRYQPVKSAQNTRCSGRQTA